jgi:hypothetical protein
MLIISNDKIREAQNLLQYALNAPGNDLKTVNARRRAKILMKGLCKLTPMSKEQYKRFLKEQIHGVGKQGMD